jgi:2-oxoglutarate ferredoxin oxidoreductase subunit beta
VNLKILLFNNQIYGLTKGQYSPTSELGKKTKTSPMGSIDYPFNPVSLALGAEATFVARTIDMDRKHMAEVLAAAAEHRGTSFIEIYQNCNVFNDKAFIELTSRETRDVNRIYLEHGKPIVFGPDNEYGVRIGVTGAEIVEVSEVGIDAIQVHNAKDPEPGVAFALSRISTGPHGPTPLGIFRSVDRAVYEDLMVGHIKQAQERRGTGDLAALIRSGGTWSAQEEASSRS